MPEKPKNNLPGKILVVEDEPLAIKDAVNMMLRQNIKVMQAKDLSSALYLFNNNMFDIAIVSQEFKELSGIFIAQKFRGSPISSKKSIPIILMSTKTKRSGQDEALITELGDIEYLAKPFQPAILLTYLARAMHHHDVNEKMDQLKTKFDEFYAKNPNFDSAITTLKKQLPVLGEKGLDMLVDLYVKEEKLEDALALVSERMGRSDKVDIKHLNTRASILLKLKRFEEAKSFFEKAESLAPQNLDRLENMATIYLETNHPEHAVEKYKKLINFSPEKPELKFNIFEKMSTYGFDEQAVKFCEQISSSKEVARHYNNLGVFKAKSGDTSEAIAKYWFALKLITDKSSRARIYFNLALSYIHSREKGFMDQAINCLKECIKLDPEFEKAKTVLEKLQE